MSPPRRPGRVEPVIVRAAPFTFRTLSPLDGLLPRNRPHRMALIMWESTFDREQTFMMPAVAGLYNCEPASCEVIL